MSTPLLGFFIFHDNFLYQCRSIQHHAEQCRGYCILKQELANQGKGNTDIPEPLLQKQLKAIDLYFVPCLNLPPAMDNPIILFSLFQSELIIQPGEIETPPPQV
jgi:hypothetical protein